MEKTWEEFPAVVEPSFLNAGFNLDKPSKEASFRTPSSVFTRASTTLPSLSLYFAVN